MAKPAQYDPILYSDWDAIQTIVYEQIGPLQEIIGSPGVFVEGEGYGLAQELLQSKAYPFIRQVKRISSETQPSVEFVLPHYLVDGEVIYFTNFNNNWGGQDIADNFATVVNVVNEFTVEIDFSTFDYTPTGNGATLWNTYNAANGTGDTCDVTQYYISANQFANLRADMARAIEHITGAPPAAANTFPGGESTDLPIPVRGGIIYYSVYDPFYEIANHINTYKYICNGQASYQPSLPSSARNANAWNQTTNFEFAVKWDTAYDFVQFFNTGGFIKIEFPNPSTVVGNSSNDNVLNLNSHWRDMINLVFPLYVGARSKTNMGLASDPRSIADVGAYDVGSTDTIIKSALGSDITGYGQKYDDHSVTVYLRESINQRELTFLVTLVDTSSTNAYAIETDLDREIKLIFQYSQYIPLASTPQNYTIIINRAWQA